MEETEVETQLSASSNVSQSSASLDVPAVTAATVLAVRQQLSAMQHELQQQHPHNEAAIRALSLSCDARQSILVDAITALRTQFAEFTHPGIEPDDSASALVYSPPSTPPLFASTKVPASPPSNRFAPLAREVLENEDINVDFSTIHWSLTKTTTVNPIWKIL
jgi:hypothetical protein